LARNNPADKYALAREITAVLETDLAAEGYELLDVRVFQGGGRWQVRVFVDTAEGIDLDQCARASRSVGMLLEEADLFAGEYLIEVSSPGIRRPLRTPTHFLSAVDRDVEITITGDKRPRKLRGTLRFADGTGVRIETIGTGAESAGDGTTEIALTYAEILEANLDAQCDVQALINAERRSRKETKRRERQARRTKKKSRRPKQKSGRGSEKDK